MFARASKIAYTLAAVAVVLGTVVYVFAADATPALLIPGVFGGVGIFLVGTGLRATVRGTASIRGGTVRRTSNPLFFRVVVAAHLAFGGGAIWFAIRMFTLPAS